MKNLFICFFVLLSVVLLPSCVTPPPREVNNICSVFKQYPQWYHDSQSVARRWWLPVHVQMAIMHQESKFDATARPPRVKLLGFLPWKRPSSAYGYAQALDNTWLLYKRSTGHWLASRETFSDAVDFMGWYANEAHRRAGISRHDPYALYLAYHEGVGGYMSRTYLKKPWLMRVAHKVEARSQIYHAQLLRCGASFSKRSWYNHWF